ncbi:cupin-like domain-containing protein [Pseudoalteromonas fenneropenaei]|uniref:Cupin-like domain-containing protein n=1 Tax=Pseudoalteromonas fenneropenaei TaxID=1737459 RepID=A0ABV7CFQ1_9GAMM
MALEPLDITSLAPVAEHPPIAATELAATLSALTTPVVLRQQVADWPIVALAKQDSLTALDYLSEHATTEPVTVFEVAPTANGRVFYNENFTGFNFRVHQGPFTRLAAQLKTPSPTGSSTFYLGSTLIERWFPRLAQTHHCGLEAHQPLTSLWLGQQSKVAAHSDFPLNLACNIIGTRRFILFPPEQVKNLYIGSLDFNPAGRPISMVDFAAVDFARFPKFEQALEHALVVDLAPGDCVYIPSMWWHYVEGLEAINAQINYWWRDTPTTAGSPSEALNHAILTLRHLPTHEKRAWQQLFEHYVFADTQSIDHIPSHLQGRLGDTDERLIKQLKQQLAQQLMRK